MSLAFHNIDGRETDPVRELIRRHCRGPSSGLVVQDIDVLVRYYGRGYGCDDDGVFALLEVKHRPGCSTHLDTAQARTFRLLDRVATGSPSYLGFFVATWEGDASLCAVCDGVHPDGRWMVRNITNRYPRLMSTPQFVDLVDRGNWQWVTDATASPDRLP